MYINEYNKTGGFFPVGGISAGYVTVNSDGTLGEYKLAPDNAYAPHGDFFGMFCIECSSETLGTSGRTVGSNAAFDTGCPCYEKISSHKSFPFAYAECADGDFPVNAKLVCLTPFVPLNAADSEIPAALFEIELENISEHELDVTVHLELSRELSAKESKVGCDKATDSAFSEYSLNEYRGNICISSDVKDITFGKDNTLFSHVKLGAKKKCTVKFAAVWYFPDFKDGRKNYYAQYFESSSECAVYCFKHGERLKNLGLCLEKALSGSTVSENLKSSLENELENLCRLPYCRFSDGSFEPCCEDFDSLGQLLRNMSVSAMFPELDKSLMMFSLRRSKSKNVSENTRLAAVLRAYNTFLADGDSEALIEIWFYISKCIDAKEVLPDSENFGLYVLCLYAGYKMACAVKDRTRKARYKGMYEKARDIFVNAKRAFQPEIYALLSHFGSLGELPEEYRGVNFDFDGYAGLCITSGFSYNMYDKSVCFEPDMTYADGQGVFKSFFCTTTGFGILEEGVDYVEIRMLCGVIRVRHIRTPRKPRMTLYGGRKWKFEEKDHGADLDNVLIVTPDKKLAVIIDASREIEI